MKFKIMSILDCINSISYYGEYETQETDPNTFNTNVLVKNKQTNKQTGEKYRISIPQKEIDDFDMCNKNILQKVRINKI